MRRPPHLILATLLVFAVGAPIATASPITTPAGLNPGDAYFLAFVTAGVRDGGSSNIADYDAFVSAEANLDPTLGALGATWNAIASTENPFLGSSVDAVAHVAVSGPVYNLAGQLVAANSADMFDGTLAAPITFDQHGNAYLGLVWTGSTFSGIHNTPLALGDNSAEIGVTGATDFRWLAASNVASSSALPFYGVSSRLVVAAATPDPTTVPEPGTITLVLSPLLMGKMRRRWRKPS